MNGRAFFSGIKSKTMAMIGQSGEMGIQAKAAHRRSSSLTSSSPVVTSSS
jgi:hypothetical protein